MKLSKGVVTQLLLQTGAFVLKGVPGFSKQVLQSQVENADLRVYESDLDGLLEKAEKLGLDPKAFLNLLIEVGAVIEGSRPAFGGKAGGASIRINSRERAEQVVTSPEPGAVEKFMELMTEIISLAEEADNLIQGKGKISVAIKNVGDAVKHRKKNEVVEVEEE